MISTRQLRYLDAVARLGHFGRAAEHCAVTQPALSMQITELERELGVELIERRPKGLVLTAAGREIADRAAKILLAVRDIADYAASCRETLAGPVRLGVIPTIAPYLLPQLLLKLRERHPDLALAVREAQTRTLTAELLDGRLDLLVLALPIEHAEVETLELGADRFLLAFPPQRSFGRRVRVSPEVIRNERLILLEEGHCLRDQALEVCSHVPHDEKQDFRATSLETLRQMVAAGTGVTLLPELASRGAYGGARGLVVRPFARPAPTRRIGAVWRRTTARAQAIDAVCEVIAGHAL